MVISERELRSLLGEGKERVVRIRRGDIVTPAARDFLRAHRFVVEHVDADGPFREMGRTVIPPSGERRFVDVDGNGYAAKPEHMTHLRGNVLVAKDHPRITFRGKLDTLQARMLEAQIAALDEGRTGVVADVQEVLDFTRDLLAAEVTEQPFGRETLLGMREDELRSVSHNPDRHFGVGHLVPDYRMGRTVVALNTVRALVREAELAAMPAFAGPAGEPVRPDLIKALNRLSSAVYIIVCRLLGGYYGSGKHGD